MYKSFVYFIIFILNVLIVHSQPIYQITNHTRQTYGGGSQNWSLDMDKNGFIYSANNNGLMVYNGVKWKIYKNTVQNIVRSVLVDQDRIYTGSFEEFGFWTYDPKGLPVYKSFASALQSNNLHNIEIWKIVHFKNKIYFQGFSSLFVYNGKTIEPIKIPQVVVFLLKAGNRLFIQEARGKLYEIINDKAVPVLYSEILIGTEVKTILEVSPNSYIIGTTSHGLFKYENGKVSPWFNPSNEILKESQINNGILFRDQIVFGTIVNGIIITDLYGNIIHKINNNNGLQNNTVLSLYNYKNLGIWVGLDNGIDYVSFSNPLHIYTAQNQALGAVYTAALYKNTLYIGTNRGIFTYKESHGNFIYEGFLKNSQGQVWQIKEIDGDLFVGHTNGTYILDNKQLRMISSVNGGYMIQKFVHNNEEFLIQSTYSALVIYKKIDGIWKYSHQLEGFNEPARFIEVDHQGNIWISHAIKGLYRIRIDNSMLKIAEIHNYSEKDGLPQSKGIKVYKINNRIVFISGKRIFTWDDIAKKIIPYANLENEDIPPNPIAGISEITDNGYWRMENNQIELYKLISERPTLQQRIVLAQYNINLVEGYENIIPLSHNQHIICLDNGFGILNITDVLKLNEPKLDIAFREILSLNASGESFALAQNTKKLRIKNSRNNISIAFSTIQEPCINRLYQYKLKGIDTGWSKWSGLGEAKYTRLPAGKYEFMVRTLTQQGKYSDPAVLEFTILKPTLLSSFAIFLYVLLLLTAILLLLRYNRKRLARQHLEFVQKQAEKAKSEKQKDEQQIILLKNANLQTEVNHKTIQLADATMAMMKKNEVLIEIKNEIERQKEDLGSRYPARYHQKITTLIEKNISNDKDWEIFEALFDQAHEDFFKRLKLTFPDLTQSDLKLCAYLKLNLASKEIAPLLNISIRGVEIRRYRLRKRLGLNSEENLVEFIMQF